MKNVKKYILITLCIIAMMFIPSIVVGAAKAVSLGTYSASKMFNDNNQTGKTVKIGYQQLTGSPYLYCIDKGGTVNDALKTYKIKAGIVIEGRKATVIGTNKSTVNDENAILSYILRNNSGYGSSVNSKTEAQWGVWQSIKPWMNTNKKDLGINIHYKGKSSNTGKNERKEAKEYAEKLKNSENSTGTVETPKVVETTISAEIAGKYTRVGPFKISFSGKISDLKVYDNNKSLPISAIKVLKKGKLETISEDKIAPNTDFYIYLDNTSGHKQITKITGKVNPTTTETVYQTTIYFLQSGEYQELIAAKSKKVPANSLDFTLPYTVDIPTTISLNIKKVDSKTSEAIEGVGFKIYNVETKQYVNAQGKLGTEQYEHFTKADGTIQLTVPEGKYQAIETTVPKGYKGISNSIDIVSNGTTTVANDPTPKCISLEGTVFIDGVNGKQSIRNNTYDQGEGINGVKVTLKRNGQVVANVASGYDSNGNSTGIDGHYKFIGDEQHLQIEVEHLSEYTIEFEYNGLKYENVAVQPQIVAGASSKAKEKQEEREAFNTRYSTVTADTKIANGQSTNKSKGGDIIRYTSQPYTSKIMYQTSSKDDKGNAYNNEAYADEQYHITAYTTEAGLDLSKPGKEGGYPYDPTKETIADINFGIYEREHPDVAISSDLAAAETSINGYTQIYPYQKRYDQIGNDSAFTVEVKASDAYYPSYQRKLYKSDVQYTQQTNDGSELAIYLTYKVAIKNQSSSINVTVNDIVDYFSKDVTGGIVAIGTDINTLTEIPAKTNGNRYQVKNANGMQYSSITEDSGYSKQYITLNKEIKTGEKYQFYVQYKMSIEAIRKTIEQDVKFNNVFELNTVSARSNNGEVWTAVDMDSAVGNCVPSDRKTMEDDTDYAPGIDITTKSNDVRQITGIVFEDQTSTELKEGQERNGNGQYDKGEQGVSNAKVQLIDIDREGQIAYSNTQGTDIKSGNDGNYTITGFIPGNYIIKYTYGDGTEKYTAQQYKSTIYVDQARANANYANGYHEGVSTGNKYWYKDEANRKSDAVDNYNGEIKTLYDMSKATINMSRTEIEKIWNQEDGMQHILNGTNIDNKIAIDAYTPHMGITVEKADTQEGNYTIPNVDFGIAERARYKVQIEKTINRIQLIKPDGSILRDFTDFKNLPENTKAIQSKRGISRGFIQFSIDTELLQTTTLLVEYGFKGTNISEVEYVDEAYYKYGIVPQDKENKLVKLSIANIIDYVDNELQYAENSHMITDGKTNVTNKSNGWSTIELNKEENKKYVETEVLNALYNENGQCAYSTILISNGLDKTMLKTGESTTISLSLNKTLVPSQDEMRYENMTEVVEIKKTWGRELSMEETSKGAGNGQKLGNFNPVKDPEDEAKIINVKDPDTSYTETILINPPEGADKNSIILYTSIGIVFLAILAAGIIIIKKKAVK